MNTVCISTKMSAPDKVGGGQNTGRPSASKSRGTCPPSLLSTHAWFAMRCWSTFFGTQCTLYSISTISYQTRLLDNKCFYW